MKIAVFSDSHRVTGPMVEAARRERPDLIIHLGDLEEDAEKLRREYPNAYMYNVSGNCDFISFAPKRLDIVLGGKRIFAAHGHTYNVKYGLDAMVNTAMVAGADILLFGHTHVPYHEVRDGLIIANPGSIGGVRSRHKTYGVITIEGDELRYENRVFEELAKGEG